MPTYLDSRLDEQPPKQQCSCSTNLTIVALVVAIVVLALRRC